MARTRNNNWLFSCSRNYLSTHIILCNGYVFLLFLILGFCLFYPLAIMSGNPPPRRAYGLPSNPRQASLKHTKSQPDLTRGSHESPVAEPLPTSSYSRPSSRASTSRARAAPARLPSRSIRVAKVADATSPARSDSALPPIRGPLRNRGNQPWSSVPSSRASLDEPPLPPPPINDSTPPGMKEFVFEYTFSS